MGNLLHLCYCRDFRVIGDAERRALGLLVEEGRWFVILTLERFVFESSLVTCF